MHVFTKTCFCQHRDIPFRSSDKFDEHAIARVFCPLCSDRAPEEGFDVIVTGVQGWSGIYSIDWNQSYLDDVDSKFSDTEDYYKKLFSGGGVMFGFLPKKHAERAYSIIGIRNHVSSAERMSGKSTDLFQDEMKKRKGRKRILEQEYYS